MTDLATTIRPDAPREEEDHDLPAAPLPMPRQTLESGWTRKLVERLLVSAPFLAGREQ